MAELVQIDSNDPRDGRSLARRPTFVHGLRLFLFAAVILCLRANHAGLVGGSRSKPPTLDLEELGAVFPEADSLSQAPNSFGAFEVLDGQQTTLGAVMQTSPESDSVVGFSGPTNTWILFDRNGKILGLQIISSGDTREHLRDVKLDPGFLSALNGKTASEASTAILQADTVSGATLTSLAILEGALRRLERDAAAETAGASASTLRSLKFPKAPALEEVTSLFPGSATLRPRDRNPLILDVMDSSGQKLGAVFRTAPAGDEIIGYQGPTDTLVALDVDDRVTRLQVRRSFDNEPYVGYVREDDYFAEVLAGKTVLALSKLDPIAQQIEGVSGATMTSMAMVDAIPLAAREALNPVEPVARPPREVRPRSRASWRIQARDWGTLAVLAAAFALAFSRIRGNRWVRFGFQFVLVAYLGFLNGDMLSQAQLIGWAGNGAPWRFAPALTLMTLAAFLAPVFTKRQIYCQHICPFGAAQQVAHPGSKRAHLGRASHYLRAVPFLLAAFAVLVGLFQWPVELAGIEPFDAFLFGSAASMVIAVVGLAASFRIPMAYCRFGCPTGAMLEYVRFHARADRLDWRDLVVALLWMVGLAAWWGGGGA